MRTSLENCLTVTNFSFPVCLAAESRRPWAAVFSRTAQGKQATPLKTTISVPFKFLVSARKPVFRMSFQDRSSSMFSDNQNILSNNFYKDAMDVESEVCCSSTSGSDHRFSTASISLCSDEISEFSDEEMSDESSALADKQRDFEGESSDDEDDQNPWDVHSDSSK